MELRVSQEGLSAFSRASIAKHHKLGSLRDGDAQNSHGFVECGVGNAGVIVMVVGGAGRVDTGLVGGSLCGLHKRLTFLNLRNKTKRKVF